MPERSVPGTDLSYHLVVLDEEGKEREEADGSRYSRTVLEHATPDVTDIFVLSHGWKGDIPAAIRQYDSWIGMMGGQEEDLQRVRDVVPGFSPLVVAVHWPSLPWGVERVGAALLGDDDTDEFAAENSLSPDEFVALYAPRIGDTQQTRDALYTILAAEQDPATADGARHGALPPDLEAAYRILYEQAGLDSQGALAAPGADQPVFDPGAAVAAWTDLSSESAGDIALLGVGDDLAERLAKAKNALLGPVRQVSFWTMKKRARIVGETGAHDLVAALQRAAGNARVHLMGHSFGCIVVSAAIAGPRQDDTFPSPLPRPVDAVFLVQGAMSLWSYAEKVPFADSRPGFFAELLTARRINGPLVATTSIHDTAVGIYYPLGARFSGQPLLGAELPEYGGIGAFGIQGADASARSILAHTAEYGLVAGDRVNVDASEVINGGNGPSGAHSDIAHSAVAHLMWQAVVSSHLS